MSSICISLFLLACHQPRNSYSETLLTTRDSTTAAKFRFNHKNYLVEEVKAGALITYSFKFVNDGKSPLMIRGIYTSCG